MLNLSKNITWALYTDTLGSKPFFKSELNKILCENRKKDFEIHLRCFRYLIFKIVDQDL